MATVTYTFAGISNPSSTHLAKPGAQGDLPPANGALTADAEATSPQYTALATSDESRASAEDMFSHALWEFHWLITVDRATVTRIDISCEGWGFADSADGWRLYIRNNTTPAWDLLGQIANDGEVTLAGAITANISDYITAGGLIYVLAEQVGLQQCDVWSTVEVDMTSCQLTYTPASTFVMAQVNG